MATPKKKLTINFIHPDLGIGGAERLVVDAAVGLQNLGHKVRIYTSHHDSKHCFEETANGTLEVKVYGDFLPRHIGGKFMIFFALLRSLYLSFCLLVISICNPSPPGVIASDVALVDQISLAIPVFKLLFPRVVFYCHFPDRLLTKRVSLLKRLYRLPFDFVEEATTGMADEILVNSQFTQQVFKQEFKSIRRLPIILHPGIQISGLNETETFTPSGPLEPLQKKGSETLKLVVAGGYDTRVLENVEHHRELEELCESFGLKHHTVVPFKLPRPSSHKESSASIDAANVIFLLSVSNTDRSFLLSKATCLIYTPTGEHFGIVPVEAMYARTPVVAVNDAGPTETIVDGETGFLRPPTPEAFSEAIEKILALSSDKRKEMGDNGRRRVVDKFTLESFSKRLEAILLNTPRKRGATVGLIRSMGPWAIPLSVAVVVGILSAFILSQRY
ncbi:Alpha-1,3-mannosyltransferase-like protein [Phlyctochytrium planicorne]|nr:Alpha-1,3-mannosyltransferase-like protein [Phlyctochytrium planicorne]